MADAGAGNVREFPPVLRAAADKMLVRARESSHKDGDPLLLLAADALVTYACEAAALYEPESLADLR